MALEEVAKLPDPAPKPPQKDDFLAKLVTVQKEIQTLKKTASNPYFKSKFVPLNEVLDVVKAQLEKHDLLLIQPVGKDQMGHYVESRICDTYNRCIYSRVYLVACEESMQKLAAAITFGRRYSLAPLLALEDEDDDGERASGKDPALLKTKIASLLLDLNDAVISKACNDKISNPNVTVKDLESLINRLEIKLQAKGEVK